MNKFFRKCSSSFCIFVHLCRMAFPLFLEVSQRYNRRLLLGLQLNRTHHPLQIMLKYCLRSLTLLFTNRNLSENLMFNKTHKPILFFKHANNVIKKQKFIVYCTQIQKDARGPWEMEIRIFCTLQD